MHRQPSLSASRADFSSTLRRKESKRRFSEKNGGCTVPVNPNTNRIESMDTSIPPPPSTSPPFKFTFNYDSLTHSQQHEALDAYFKFDNVESEIPAMLAALRIYLPEEMDLSETLAEMNQDEASGFSVSPEGFLHVVSKIWTIQLSHCGEDADIRNAYEALDVRMKQLRRYDADLGSTTGGDSSSSTGGGTTPIGNYLEAAAGREQQTRSVGESAAASSDEEDALLLSKPAFKLNSRNRSSSHCRSLSSTHRRDGSTGKKSPHPKDDPLLKLLAPLMNREFPEFRRFLRTKEEDPVFLTAFLRLGALRADGDSGPLFLDSDTLRRRCQGLGCDDSATQIILNFFDDDVNGEIDFKEFKRLLTMDITTLMSQELVEYMRKLLCFDERQLAAAVARQEAANVGPMGKGKSRHRSLVQILSVTAPGNTNINGNPTTTAVNFDTRRSAAGTAEESGGVGQSGGVRRGSSIANSEWRSSDLIPDDGVSNSPSDAVAAVAGGGSVGGYYNAQSQLQYALRRLERQLHRCKHHVNTEMKQTSDAARKLLKTADQMTHRGISGAHTTRNTTTKGRRRGAGARRGQLGRKGSQKSSPPSAGKKPNAPFRGKGDDACGATHHKTKARRADEAGPLGNTNTNQDDDAMDFITTTHNDSSSRHGSPSNAGDSTTAGVLELRASETEYSASDDSTIDTESFLPDLGPDRRKPEFRTHVKCAFQYRPKVTGKALEQRQPQQPSHDRGHTVSQRQTFLGSLPSVCYQSPRKQTAPTSRTPHQVEDQHNNGGTHSNHDDTECGGGGGGDLNQKKNAEDKSSRRPSSRGSSGGGRTTTTSSTTTMQTQVVSLCHQVLRGYSKEAREVAANPLLFSAHIQKATLPKKATVLINRQMTEEAVTTTNGRYFGGVSTLPPLFDEIALKRQVGEEGGRRQENRVSGHFTARSYEASTDAAQMIYSSKPSPPKKGRTVKAVRSRRDHQPQTARV